MLKPKCSIWKRCGTKESALEWLDKSIHDEFWVDEALMCIRVVLLCVQERTYGRPTMLLYDWDVGSTKFYIATTKNYLPVEMEQIVTLKIDTTNEVIIMVLRVSTKSMYATFFIWFKDIYVWFYNQVFISYLFVSKCNLQNIGAIRKGLTPWSQDDSFIIFVSYIYTDLNKLSRVWNLLSNYNNTANLQYDAKNCRYQQTKPYFQ